MAFQLKFNEGEGDDVVFLARITEEGAKAPGLTGKQSRSLKPKKDKTLGRTSDPEKALPRTRSGSTTDEEGKKDGVRRREKTLKETSPEKDVTKETRLSRNTSRDGALSPSHPGFEKSLSRNTSSDKGLQRVGL